MHERRIHLGNRCPHCGGRAITWWDKVGGMRASPHNRVWTCRCCGTRVRVSWAHLVGWSIALCIPLVVASHLYPDVRLRLTTVTDWVCFSAVVASIVVLTNWLFVRFVPLRLAD